jgi:hypothetical protein
MSYRQVSTEDPTRNPVLSIEKDEVNEMGAAI